MEDLALFGGINSTNLIRAGAVTVTKFSSRTEKNKALLAVKYKRAAKVSQYIMHIGQTRSTWATDSAGTEKLGTLSW
jgi:hypothetical protein